jgi:hypothetical protein
MQLNGTNGTPGGTPASSAPAEARTPQGSSPASAFDFTNLTRREIGKALDSLVPNRGGMRSVFLENPGLRISIGPNGHENHFGDPDEKVNFVDHLQAYMRAEEEFNGRQSRFYLTAKDMLGRIEQLTAAPGFDLKA